MLAVLFDDPVRSSGESVHIFNPGSSGQVKLSDKGAHCRTGAFNLYSFSDDPLVAQPLHQQRVLRTASGRRVHLGVERFLWDDSSRSFLPESGGAYASGL